MYVPAAGTATLNAPLGDVVPVTVGAAGTPHAITVFDSEARQVDGFGNEPIVTVKPASAAPDVYSSAVPDTAIGVAVGAGVGDGVGDGVAVEPAGGETVDVPLGTTALPPDELPPPPPHATTATAVKMNTPHTIGFICPLHLC